MNDNYDEVKVTSARKGGNFYHLSDGGEVQFTATIADTIEPKDMVNHPPHYEREGAMECIDEMLMIFGKETVKHFCLCNAWKYRYRAADKNGIEDIKKSDWYIAKYKELNEQLDYGYCATDNPKSSITIKPL